MSDYFAKEYIKELLKKGISKHDIFYLFLKRKQRTGLLYCQSFNDTKRLFKRINFNFRIKEEMLLKEWEI